MLQRVDVGERSLSAYRGIVPDPILTRLGEQARRLQGVRVLHLNATPYGGGVSELLRSLVPSLRILDCRLTGRSLPATRASFELPRRYTTACKEPKETWVRLSGYEGDDASSPKRGLG
jgi:trehalose synthase